jgi:hypothetical protein
MEAKQDARPKLSAAQTVGGHVAVHLAAVLHGPKPAPTGAQDARVYCVAPDGTAGGDGSRARSCPPAKTAFERWAAGRR